MNGVEGLSNGVTLRWATEADVPVLVNCLLDILDRYWLEQGQEKHPANTESLMRVANLEQYYFAGLLDPNCRTLVAEVDGEIAGFMRVQKETIPSFFIHSEILYIDDIYVFENFRRQGIAVKLIDEAERIAREDFHVARIQARVYGWNQAMLDAFAKKGYDVPYATVNKVLDAE